MPGAHIMARDPLGGQRRSYSLRGTVYAHSVRETGWWIFKERIPILKIRLNSEQVEVFNRLARERMSVGDGCNLQGIASDLAIGVAEDKLVKYPVGAPVAITFGYAGPIEQYFNGRDPLAVTDVQVITDDTVLENEIEAPPSYSNPSSITSVIDQNVGTRHGGTECLASCLTQWLDGATGRLVIVFNDGQQVTLTPTEPFTKKSGKLTLNVEFKE